VRRLVLEVLVVVDGLVAAVRALTAG